MPVVGIDWPRIKQKLGGGTFIYALTDRQASMLLTLSEQLTWPKTFRTADYDWSDKDELDHEIADLQTQLTMPVSLVDLIQYIDEIEDLLRALQSVNNCCTETDWTGGDGYNEPIDENSPNGVPQHLIDSGFAADDDDWDGFMDFQCQVANVIVNNAQSKVVQMEDIFDNAGLVLIGVAALVGLVSIVFSAGTSLLFAGVLASAGAATRLWTALQEGGIDAVPSPEEIELSREALVCAWMEPSNDGVDDRILAYHDAIDAEFNAAEALILKALQPAEWLKALYTGNYTKDEVTTNLAQKMVDQGIGPGTYTCDNCPGQFSCADSVLEDCSFESAGLTNGWLKSPDAYMPTWSTDAVHGTYSVQQGGGSGWPTRYMYQRFTAEGGAYECTFWAKRVAATYATTIEIRRVSNSALIATLVPGQDPNWHERYYTAINLSAGVEYEVRIGNGSYHLIDNLRLYLP